MAEVRRPRVPVELAVRIDAVRGGVPFERWVREALEQALEATPARASEMDAHAGQAPGGGVMGVFGRKPADPAPGVLLGSARSAVPVPRSSGRPAASDAALARQAKMNKVKGL